MITGLSEMEFSMQFEDSSELMDKVRDLSDSVLMDTRFDLDDLITFYLAEIRYLQHLKPEKWDSKNKTNNQEN